MNDAFVPPADDQIVRARPAKNRVDPWRPYAFLAEPEFAARGQVVDVATVFLTNRECPYRCLMCDLWKHTTNETVPRGAIPAQIDYALARLPPARHLKLYNSGNFFDRKAIPPGDHDAIARRAACFENVVVENHPRLCSAECLRFRDRIQTRLEVALGLETVHPAVLAALNKQMTLADFDRAAGFLLGAGIGVRAFILLRPPLLDEVEGVEWALRSIEHAFACGVECCSVIPARAGNGIMETLTAGGWFHPPRLASLETVLEAGLALGRGRVFADLWDIEQLPACPRCRTDRIARLSHMNRTQQAPPRLPCDCEDAA